MDQFNTVYRGKRVLVTGHTGFKGGWLTLWLHSLGAQVCGYSLAPHTSPSLFDLAQIGDIGQSHIGDIRDQTSLHEAMVGFDPEVVLHLAAQPIVRASYDDPVETFETNVMGTINVLEGVRKCPNVLATVVITSDKCYQNNEWHWGYRENEPMGGHDPYSASKGCTELVAQSWRLSFLDEGRGGTACGLATARAGNVIGGGDWSADRLIPDILRSIVAGEPVVVRNPSAVRPWQHVLEPLMGYLMLAERLASGDRSWADGWNFGPAQDSARPVEWIVNAMLSHWPGGGSWELDRAEAPHEARYLKLDCSKAHDLLGWTPVWSLDRSLQEIVAWHQAHAEDSDMRQFSLDQIAGFGADVRQSNQSS